MARSVAAQTEGLTFTGADIWVPRDQLVGTSNSVFLLGTTAPYYEQTTGTVSNGGGRPAPARWARTTRHDPLCATPPSATHAYTQLDGQRFSDPQDSQGRPRTSDAAVAAVTGSRSSGACWLFRQHESHADAPMRRISYRGGLPPPCTALRPARGCSRAVQPLESRRGDLPTPRLSTLFSLAVNVVTLSAQSTSTAPAAVSASWPCALERRSRGASSWPHTARGFGALSR